jgi:PAS domain S-box-containing protein
MAKAKRAERALGNRRERSRTVEQRERDGRATNVLDKQTSSTEEDCSFPIESTPTASEGVSRLERLIRERTRELEEVNAALRASESTLRSFYESAPLMMGVVEVPTDDSDIVHIYGNPATDRFFGRPLGSTHGQSALGMGVPKEAVRRWIEQYRLAERGGKPVQFEYWHPRESGAVWLSAVVAMIGPGNSGRTRFSYVVADLTERKRAEEALRASERLHRAIGESIQYGIWICDPQGRNTYASESFLKLVGLTQEQCSEFGWGNVLHPEDAEETVAAWKECVQAGEPWYREHRYRGVNGQWHPVLSCGVPVRDDQGHITCWAGINLDVSRLKAVEEALRASETRLSQAIHVASLGTFEHNHVTDAIEYSPLMRKMMDFGEQEEITLQAVGEKIAPEDREAVIEAIQKAHDPAGDGSYAVEFRVRTRDGRVRWISKRSQTTFEGIGNERRPVRTVGSGLDVTARKETEAELEKLVVERTAKLQELIEDLEHFSYSITHDMRAPLRAMRGFAELATIRFGKNEQEARELLRKVSASAERMDALIRDALNYSRSVRQVLSLEDVDTGALLRGMLDSYPELQPSRAHIRVEGELPVVLGNEAGLTQCFSNLLENAVKFVKVGQMPDVRVWGEEREGWARIWVADKGIGISRDMLPRVFDMYSRGSNRYEGTGVGLALVRKVAQRMGGRVGVESEEGSGSRFWIELKNGEGQLKAKRTAGACIEPGCGTVLYVEDEQTDALFMSTAFADKGLTSAFRLVSDGRAAIEYLSGTGKYADRKEYPLPAVVLLDLNLPQVPGFDVLKWMRNHPDFLATPVIVFTSSVRQEDKVKATELGANEFVAKPSSGMRFGEVVEGLRQRWLSAATHSSQL